MAALLVGCGGGGGGGGGGNNNPPPGSTVTVSGKITFDRIPFRTTTGTGLNPGAPVESPARQVVVEVLSASNAVLASTVTNASGDYSLAVPMQTNMFVRAKAQMQKTDAAPTWNFSVRNNANADALYVLDGSNFNSGTANSTRNLRATSGWGGSSYTGTRAAAPFAILDTIYQTKELILSASASTVFPALDLFWSSSNRASTNSFCPDTGDIGTSFYVGPGFDDECTPAGTVSAGIYILGDFAGGSGDTDEFDSHVIAHEFGHYLEDNFSRSDSLGGDHAGGDRLDLRVAFGEGWGNAYSAMAMNDPAYRDSFSGVSDDFVINLESGLDSAPGWYSELSIQRVLWDLFDSTNDGADTLSLGFAPLWDVMLNGQRTTTALTSIFSFAANLKAANPSIAPAINARLGESTISGTDAFGDMEVNAGGNADVSPIYLAAPNPGTLQVCTNPADGTINKLGNRRFLNLTLTQSANVNITVTGLVGSQVSPPPDPEIYLWTGGDVEISDASGTQETLQRALEEGTHIIEVYECTHGTDPSLCHPGLTNPPARGRTCMTVAVQVN